MGFQYCIEICNPNFLKDEYFDFLAKQRLNPVLLQGYYMPSIFDQYENFKARLSDPVVLRLHGLDRQGSLRKVQKMSGIRWSIQGIDELLQLRNILNDLRKRQNQVFLAIRLGIIIVVEHWWIEKKDSKPLFIDEIKE